MQPRQIPGDGVAAVVDRGVAVIDCSPHSDAHTTTAVSDRGYIGACVSRPLLDAAFSLAL
jgi:hypothetical protein